MSARTFIGNARVAAVVLSLLSVAALPDVLPGQARPGQIQPEQVQDPRGKPDVGHVVLILEGSVKNLRVAHAVAKTAPWAGVKKGLRSEFAFVALDAEGKELHRVPIDLSAFETDPDKADKPVVVNGCEVKSPRISVLCNVPRDDKAQRFEVRRGKQVLSLLSREQLQRLLGGGR